MELNKIFASHMVFAAKKLSDEAFEGRFDTEELRVAALKKYDSLKDVVLN